MKPFARTQQRSDHTVLRRGVEALGSELRGVMSRARLSAVVGIVIPDGSAHRLRTVTLRACGWRIGTGSILASVPTLSGEGPLIDRLSIGEEVYVNVGGHWDLNERIEIGDRVSIGHEVLLLTSTHHLGGPHRRAAALDHRPIRIGHGVWIGARALVLPGVNVGDGAVIGAGTVVRHDVPPSCLYAGEPGRVIRMLDQR